MKYFLFTDPHGHFTELKEALLAARYDETNENHMLIGMGDYFDRGKENAQMAKFLLDQHKKGKAVYILGNHDQMLIDFLTGKGDGIFNCIHNGFGETIQDLSGLMHWQYIANDQDYAVKKIKGNFPGLLKLLTEMKEEIRIGDYIITHAGYSNDFGSSIFHDKWSVNNWAHTEKFVQDFHTATIYEPNKKYIFGHWHAFQLRQKFGYSYTNKPTPEPFVHKNFIGLDACTALTKKVNVYIIED